MVLTEANTDTGDVESLTPGPFEKLVGDSTQTRVLRYLAQHDERYQQVEIAGAIDVSQASVSRAVQPLRELDVIDVRDDGIRLAETATTRSLRNLMTSIEYDYGPDEEFDG